MQKFANGTPPPSGYVKAVWLRVGSRNPCAVMAAAGLIVIFPGDMALRDHQHATMLVSGALPDDVPDNVIYKVGVVKKYVGSV